MSEATVCKGLFYRSFGRFGEWGPCTYRAKRDGYCGIHHPDAVAARAAKSAAQYREQEAALEARDRAYGDRLRKEGAESAEADANRLAEALKAVEWSGGHWTHDGSAPNCPSCHADTECPHIEPRHSDSECPDKPGEHRAGCQLATALRKHRESGE